METIQEKAENYVNALFEDGVIKTMVTRPNDEIRERLKETFMAGHKSGNEDLWEPESDASKARSKKREDNGYREACAVAILAAMMINADRSEPAAFGSEGFQLR